MLKGLVSVPLASGRIQLITLHYQAHVLGAACLERMKFSGWPSYSGIMKSKNLKRVSSVFLVSAFGLCQVLTTPSIERERLPNQNIQKQKKKNKNKKGWFCATAFEIRLVNAQGEIIDQTSSDVSVGQPTRKVEPGYPTQAVISRVQGTVIVEAIVSEAGDITSIRSELGPPALTKASTEAAKKWRFTPTTLRGSPVQALARITFKYDLGIEKGK